MKLKHFLCAVIATTVLATSAVGSAFAENSVGAENVSVQKPTAETATAYAVTEDTVAALGLENPCFVSNEGSVEIEEGVLIDLILPKELNEKDLTSIAAKSFAGCPYIRSVVVPETILEIGEDAFADCEFLETIYVFGHQEDDLTLGENWNGGAEVVYIAEETTAETEGEAGTEDVQRPAKEDENAGNAEEVFIPAAETNSVPTEETNTDGILPSAVDESDVPSDNVDETAAQENTGMSTEGAESNDGVENNEGGVASMEETPVEDSPVEDSETAEA